MRWLVDLVYVFAGILTAPIWLVRLVRTGKWRTDWKSRLGLIVSLPAKTTPRVLIHAVSVGEVNAVRLLVDRLAAAQQVEIVVATTTETGYRRATELWGTNAKVVRYPFDFSLSVTKFLNAVRPDVVALVELEVWPNFTAACARRSIPVCIVNGRLTARSFRRYRRIAALIAPSFRRICRAGVQNEAYAERFRALGLPGDRIQITGTMKWDTAQIADDVPGADALAREMGIDRSKPLIVAGSTAPDEHELLLACKPPEVQLLCAPRKPEWFEQAANALPGCVRRSDSAASGGTSELFLLDTIGELRKAYSLADIVVVGRSFGTLYGSDMMEPIALGKATVVGPAVADFQDVMNALLQGGGVIQTSRDRLAETLAKILANPAMRQELSERGRSVIRSQQGATERSARLILDSLHETGSPPKPNPPSRLAAATAVEEKEERL